MGKTEEIEFGAPPQVSERHLELEHFERIEFGAPQVSERHLELEHFERIEFGAPQVSERHLEFENVEKIEFGAPQVSERHLEFENFEKIEFGAPQVSERHLEFENFEKIEFGAPQVSERHLEFENFGKIEFGAPQRSETGVAYDAEMSLSKPSVLRTRPVLIDAMGRWVDTQVHSYLGVAACDRVRYFDTFESLYRTEGVPVTGFNKREMDEAFGKFKHLDCGSNFQEDRYGRLVSRLFRIEGGYEWRMPRAGERLYDRDAEGWMAIPISHFKAGLRLPMHKFMSDLFKYYFRCSPAQFSLNAIRVILWFIAACAKDGRQPTFKGFFALFYVRVTSAKPFYEIHWNSYTAVAKRVSGQSIFRFPKGMANWQEEFIMVRGGDLAYLPNFALEVRNVYPTEKKGLSEDVVDLLERTVRSLGRMWTEVDFFENARLLEHNLLIPTRGDLPVLEGATYNEPEKQREFLNAMPPRESVNVHPPRERKGARSGAGGETGGVASVGRKVIRKRKSILVDEEDAGFGELDASGATVMGGGAEREISASLGSDEDTVIPGGEDDDDADSDLETDDGGGDLDDMPAGMSEMVVTSSSEDVGDGGADGGETEERIVVEDVASSSEDDCREVVKEGEPVDGDTIVERALVPFVGDAGEDDVADRGGEATEQAEEVVGDREELEPDEVAPGGAIVKVAAVKVGGRLKKRKRAVDVVVDESRKKVKSVHEVGESSRTGNRLRMGGACGWAVDLC
ncbi:hypothetical protein POM88_041802 [Heracleum sosnowskyi]|uniref:Transposase (putative) gypsy type domain-containing protein n=1 Tax=Heracleum sosnowskyi TaxID=360622 RepID=A0AAD8MA23_9APIA|nr:hypothetical protein POM88_041802 [Heracleum sosnowskyi]